MKQYTVEFLVRATINSDEDEPEFGNDLSDYEIEAMVTMPDITDIETITEHDSL